MGSIEAGKRADLIAVDTNLDVVQTFVGGLNLGVLRD
jgi:N-acetylglucosamine-6-phosphate deacetylase